MPKIKNGMRPVHPGEMLREEFLVPMNLSASALAHALKVPPNRITMLVAEKRGMTAETALRLARHFSMSAEFWMNCQKAYELRLAEQTYAETINSEVSVRKTG